MKSAGDGGIRLNGNPGGAEISVGTHTFGNGPGIQLHYNSGNPQFFAGTSGNYIKYTVANGVDIQTTKFVLDSDNFDVTEDGDITGSAVLFTGGKIAGWNISGDVLQNNNGTLRLNGRNTTPKITIGTHTVGNGPGIQLGYSSGGTLTFFAGESATDFIKYTAGTGIDIKTQKFELDATDLSVSSTHKSMSLGHDSGPAAGGVKLDGSGGGSLAMGTSLPENLSSNGVFISGSGDFNFQGDTSNFLRKIGTAVTIASETFGLDAGSLIISSSMDSGNGVIRLGSSGGPSSPTANTAGIYMDGGGALNVYGNAVVVPLPD